MMHYLFFLYTLFFTLNLVGQESPLWSAEVEVLVNTDLFEPENQSMRRIAQRPQESSLVRIDEFSYTHIGWQVAAAILDGDLQAYKDANLQLPLSRDEVSGHWCSPDTIVTYDPISYEQRLVVVTACLNAADFRYVGLTVRLEYFATGIVKQQIVSGSLRELQFDANGNEISPRTPLYFPVTTVANSLDIDLAGWNLIDQYTIQMPLDEVVLNPDNEQSTAQMIDQQLTQLITGGDDNFVGVNGDFKPLTQTDRKAYNNKFDTVITYDPVTYVEDIEIIENTFSPDVIQQFELIQFWSWEEAKKELTVYPVGYALMMPIIDENGNTLFSRPLFYYVEKQFRE